MAFHFIDLNRNEIHLQLQFVSTTKVLKKVILSATFYSASTFKEIFFLRKILRITRKTKGNKIFKEKLRKVSDFSKIFRTFVIKRTFPRYATKIFLRCQHFLAILSTLKVAIEYGT